MSGHMRRFVVAYSRVSSSHQSERGASLFEQRAAIERVADRDGADANSIFDTFGSMLLCQSSMNVRESLRRYRGGVEGCSAIRPRQLRKYEPDWLRDVQHGALGQVARMTGGTCEATVLALSRAIRAELGLNPLEDLRVSSLALPLRDYRMTQGGRTSPEKVHRSALRSGALVLQEAALMHQLYAFPRPPDSCADRPRSFDGKPRSLSVLRRHQALARYLCSRYEARKVERGWLENWQLSS